MLTIDTQTRVIHRGNFDHCYTEDCFVNPDAYDFHHKRAWPGRTPRAWVIHEAGYVRAIVFAEYYAFGEQDAFDAAADVDYLQVTDSELADYEVGEDSEGNPEYEGIIYLGNASEPFDSQNLECFTVPVDLFAGDLVIAKVIAENPEEE